MLAVSALEHLTRNQDDRTALREVHRVLRPGGQAVVTVPFRAAGSVIELLRAEPFQRHYSPATLRRSLLEPSGLVLEDCVLYGERLPFYAATRRLPPWADRLRRPVDTILTAALMRPQDDPGAASAALLKLRRPAEEG